jgi:hypothetical protein
MKKSILSFADGFGIMPAMAKKVKLPMAFDWDRAAIIIKERFGQHPDLIAEAGLQNDWAYTGGVIFENGKPTNDNYTYLCSCWATPTLILSWDGLEQEEVECFTAQSERFDSGTKWDEQSLFLLEMQLNID